MKRAPNALSAWRMPKNVDANFGVEVNVVGSNGKDIYGTNGKVLKTEIKMGHSIFQGKPQSLYFFPPDHENAGLFKGMAIILEEQSFKDARKLHAECNGFKCT